MNDGDSIEQLTADILASDPAAVTRTVDDKAEEFLRACVRFAKTWQLSDDPWLGISHMINATIWINHAQEDLSKEIVKQAESKGIGIE
jgi:hypothetical protein